MSLNFSNMMTDIHDGKKTGNVESVNRSPVGILAKPTTIYPLIRALRQKALEGGYTEVLAIDMPGSFLKRMNPRLVSTSENSRLKAQPACLRP